ncbi:hypothetical protein Ahy_B03g062510 [Arachis hypogaea]|uniref:CCHC-type domain-containing protein n=1 Tax=Arachis hypogaea TaxID=3818 RepID=A0A444ZUI6_ARAHY|nr:hypothetical protein Ahy_B03g062510 [Arachis hypogaea]
MQKCITGNVEKPTGVTVIDIGSKKMLFSFKDRKKGLQIMQNGPWNVRGNMVNLRLWREGESVFEVDHDFIEFWIQIHGIPLDLMDKETGARIGEMLGVLAEAEDPKIEGILRRSYLRIRVSIDITKALPTGFWLDREELPPLWVFFIYERLSDSYCFNCGILGHEKKTCKNPTAMASWDPTKKRYTPGLGAGNGRPRSTAGGESSKQQSSNEEGEGLAREQQNQERESGEKQNSEESRIREEQALQQKITEESVRENQTEREEEMAEAEEQVEKVQQIPDFQGIRSTQNILEAAYKFKSLIEEIMERKNEWANNNKAQKGEKMIGVQRLRRKGPTKENGANIEANILHGDNGERNGLKEHIIEEGEVNSYSIAKGRLGLGNEARKETIGQELKRLMLVRHKGKQICEDRMGGNDNLALLKGEKEEDKQKKLSKERHKRDHKNPVFQKRRKLWQELTGSKYTWFSNPRNNFITRERLDRVLVNWKWLQIYQNVSLKAAPAISSDHCALILEIQPRSRIKREFRFEAFWAEHEECREVIKKGWQQDDGNRNFQKIRRETGKDQERILCKLGCVCWYIWKTRNQYIFQQAKINPEQAIINAEYLAVEYHNTTRESSTDHNSSNGIIGDRKRITWRTPPQDRLKVNTDAAFHRDTGKAASAVVVRNWQGKIITGTTTKFITTSALAAEAQAYREALILIKNLQIENCIIETDCLPLVQAVKARTPIAEVDAILRDILQLLEEAPAVRAT